MYWEYWSSRISFHFLITVSSRPSLQELDPPPLSTWLPPSFNALQLHLAAALFIVCSANQTWFHTIAHCATRNTHYPAQGAWKIKYIHHLLTPFEYLHVCRYLDILISIHRYMCVKGWRFPSVDPEWVSVESLTVSLGCQLWAALINPRRNWWGSQLRILHHDAVIWQTLKQHRGKIVAIELKFNLYCDVLTPNGRFAEAFKFQTTGHQSHISFALFSLRRMGTDVPSLYPTQFVTGLINVFPLNIYLSVDRLMLRYGDADILLYLGTLLRSVSRQDLCQWRAPCSSLQSIQYSLESQCKTFASAMFSLRGGGLAGDLRWPWGRAFTPASSQAAPAPAVAFFVKFRNQQGEGPVGYDFLKRLA